MIWTSRCMKFLCILILSFTFAVTFNPSERASAFTNQVIQKGATGYDVIELQARLQYIGYYRGRIDGVFGWSTYWALRNFQKNFGLKVDGLGGLKTRQKLVAVSKYDEQWVRTQIRKGRLFTYYGGTPKEIQTKYPRNGKGNVVPGKNRPQAKRNWPQAKRNRQQANRPPKRVPGQIQRGRIIEQAQNVPEGFSQNEINSIARMVYAESKGEPYIGQVAVAAVILNRINSPKFPNSVAGTMYQSGAFEAASNGELWVGQPNREAKKAVLDALNGWDPSGGALYYFNPAKATSTWIWSRPQIKKIGRHIFTK